MKFWQFFLLGNSYNAGRKLIKLQKENPKRIPIIFKIIGIGLILIVLYLLTL